VDERYSVGGRSRTLTTGMLAIEQLESNLRTRKLLMCRLFCCPVEYFKDNPFGAIDRAALTDRISLLNNNL